MALYEQDDFDSYVHRIGRTGRAGRSGRATAFFVPGYEPKVGNQVLYGDLKRLFEENQQQLPEWFLHGMSGAAAGGGGGGGGGRSGAQPICRKAHLSWASS